MQLPLPLFPFTHSVSVWRISWGVQRSAFSVFSFFTVDIRQLASLLRDILVLICIGGDSCCYGNYFATILRIKRLLFINDTPLDSFQGQHELCSLCLTKLWSSWSHHWRQSALSTALHMSFLSGFTQAVRFANHGQGIGHFLLSFQIAKWILRLWEKKFPLPGTSMHCC